MRNYIFSIFWLFTEMSKEEAEPRSSKTVRGSDAERAKRVSNANTSSRSSEVSRLSGKNDRITRSMTARRSTVAHHHLRAQASSSPERYSEVEDPQLQQSDHETDDSESEIRLQKKSSASDSEPERANQQIDPMTSAGISTILKTSRIDGTAQKTRSVLFKAVNSIFFKCEMLVKFKKKKQF